ncbi:hypothetical protein LCL90_18240 [Bacillus infantis]|uniref:hypothetical protein n=1 Tax=Bacillus infantis TaxID=324767 RepID=UPI001CD5E747|nr:hypothetical protein [Bacillus infantis]MCA1036586.1 hypothetical protein [Bacillus infantis]
MKKYRLKTGFNGRFKRGTVFWLIAESEFIGIKEYVLRTKDLEHRIQISEEELMKHFVRLNDGNGS